ncbi:MAG: HDIG domain-containing protein [Gemmatimonadales bacterium]|nr:HDIG domain-containing protein [Gemmatimonadales bacterium]
MSLSGRVRHHGLRWAPLFAVALATYVAFPPPMGGGPALPEVGQIARRGVTAPFAYEVRKSPDEIARESESRALTVHPAYWFSATAYDSALASARRFFAELERAADQGPERLAEAVLSARLDAEQAAFLADPAHRAELSETVTHFLAEALSRGVADAGVMRGEASSEVTLRRGDTERAVPRDSITTFADLMQQAEAAGLNLRAPVAQRTLRHLVGAFYQPTIVPDLALTTSRRERLRASVDPVKYAVAPGEVIVRPGQVITDESRAKLAGMREERSERGDRGVAIRSGLGALLYNIITLSIFWLLLQFSWSGAYAEPRQLVFFALLFSVVVLVTGGVNAAFPGRPELIPIPFAAILVTLLYDGRTGVFAAVTLAILLAGQPVLRETPTLFFGVAAGAAGALGIRVVRRRRHLYIAIGLVAGASSLATVAMTLSQGWPPQLTVASITLGVLMALASASFAMICMPLAEWGTRITTDLTLLELSDLGRPLLRRLALEAPGTWAHSLAMANLCESACNIIGANGLLARVGCYYHDVGKLADPKLFMENQGGAANAHDDLNPIESAKIIRNHVVHGIALADAAGLPPVVKAFIPEHHGTTEITFFLGRAKRLGLRVDPADFRYPGPRPRSAETAVAMLADSAEAVIRVLDRPTPEAVRDAIEQLVQQKVSSGQLDDAPLRLQDLDRVKREFARVMSGTYHKRIGYPHVSGAIPAALEPVRHD